MKTHSFRANAPATGLVRHPSRLHKPFLGRQAVPEGGASSNCAGRARARLSVAASASPPQTQVRGPARTRQGSRSLAAGYGLPQLTGHACRPPCAPPPGAQAPPQPPPESKYEATEEVLRVTGGVTCIRSVCTTRLPDIEFGRKHGTTTNTYLLRVSERQQTRG